MNQSSKILPQERHILVGLHTKNKEHRCKMAGSDKSYDDKVKQNKGLESGRVAREDLLRRPQWSKLLHAQSK